MDGANFCINCGNRLENTDEKTEIEEVIDNPGSEDENTALIVTDQSEEKTVREDTAARETLKEDHLKLDSPAEPLWYYVERKESVGPFAQNRMIELYREGKLSNSSWVWTQGLEKWVHLDESDLYPLISGAQEAGEPASAIDELMSASENTAAQTEPDHSAAFASDLNSRTVQEPDWFYVDNGKSAGPYSETAMRSLIEQRVLSADTYVWKEGMNDWQRLGDTELGRYIPAGTSSDYMNYGRPASAPEAPQSYNNAPRTALYVQDHSVILYILLCILTCGIWQLVWMYMLARDINTLASRQNRPTGPDPILSVILTFLTCGIYQIYFFWKEENVLAQVSARNYQVQNQSVLTGILGFICPIASAAIIQDQINCLVRYE